MSVSVRDKGFWSDAVAAELLKLRSLRSSWVVAATAVVAIVVGTGLAMAITADYDGSPPDLRAHFASADMSVVVMPMLTLLVATIAGTVFTAEHGTGMIRAVLLGVPVRRRLFTAKVAAVAGAALAVGTVVAVALCAVALAVVGDRPAPIAPWASFGDAVPSALAWGAVVTVTALLALGLGAVIRSTAGTAVTVTLLLFVVPGMGLFLPSPLDEWIFGCSLLNLAPQLAGQPDSVFSPATAAVIAAVYLVVPLAAGWLSFTRRDA